MNALLPKARENQVQHATPRAEQTRKPCKSLWSHSLRAAGSKRRRGAATGAISHRSRARLPRGLAQRGGGGAGAQPRRDALSGVACTRPSRFTKRARVYTPSACAEEPRDVRSGARLLKPLLPSPKPLALQRHARSPHIYAERFAYAWTITGKGLSPPSESTKHIPRRRTQLIGSHPTTLQH
jgi:hypothetical protein